MIEFFTICLPYALSKQEFPFRKGATDVIIFNCGKQPLKHISTYLPIHPPIHPSIHPPVQDYNSILFRLWSVVLAIFIVTYLMNY